jgi:hypothetical protein
MRQYLLALASIVALLAAHPSYAFTQSADLERDTGQYLNNASVDLPFPDVTIEGWFNFESVPTTDVYGLVNTLTTVGHRSFLWGYCPSGVGCSAGNNVLFFAMYGGATGEVDSDNMTAPSANTWTYLAVTFSDSADQVKFYSGTTDGAVTQIGATKTTTLTVNDFTDLLQIGQYAGAAQNFDGKMSNIKIWNTARTEAQIESDMCATYGATSGLIGEWSLDNTLTDNSGNGYTLTNNNSVTFAANVPVCAAPAAPASNTTLIWFD